VTSLACQFRVLGVLIENLYTKEYLCVMRLRYYSCTTFVILVVWLGFYICNNECFIEVMGHVQFGLVTLH